MFRLTLAAAMAAAFFSVLSPAPARAADAIDGVLTPYFRIQAQLADDKGDVKADAELVAQAASGLGAQGEPIATAARTLAGSTSLAAARDAFGTLSDALIVYADSTHDALEGATTAYCPMVKKSWVQQGASIRNPYFGKSMLACGSVKKRG